MLQRRGAHYGRLARQAAIYGGNQLAAYGARRAGSYLYGRAIQAQRRAVNYLRGNGGLPVKRPIFGPMNYPYKRSRYVNPHKGRQHSRKPSEAFREKVQSVIGDNKGDRTYHHRSSTGELANAETCNWFQLGRFDRTRTTAFYTDALVGNETKVKIKVWRDDCLISNASNGVIFLERYSITARRDLSATEITAFDNNSLVTALAAADGLAGNFQQINANLYYSHDWQQKFRIGKCKKLKIRIGGTLKQTLFQKFPITNNTYQPGTGAEEPVLLKETKFYFYKFHGAPVWEDLGTATGTDVAVGHTKIGVIYDTLATFNIIGEYTTAEVQEQVWTTSVPLVTAPVVFEPDGSLKQHMETGNIAASILPGD